MNKHLREVQRIAKDFGASVTVTKKHHLKVAGNGWLVFTSSTPSDRRSIKNFIMHIRKASQAKEVSA